MIAPSVINAKRTLSVMTTFTCTAACTNCGTLSSPTAKGNLDLDDILRIITEAKELGFFNVVFTGGEATLRWEVLIAAIKHAKKLGFPTRLVTNGHWAVSAVEANNALEALITAGLDELNLSTGDQHARFVPIEKVVLAATMSAQRSLPVSVMVELRGESRVTKLMIEEALQQHLDNDTLRRLINIIESPWMPLNHKVAGSYPPSMAVTHANVETFKGCDSILQTYVVQGDGLIASCCGLGVRLIPELNVSSVSNPRGLAVALEEAESDMLKYVLRYMGTEKLLAWAASKNPKIHWEGMYAHRCQVCQRIYRDPVVAETIRQHFHELVCDTVFSAWLEENYLSAIPEMASSCSRY